MRREAVGRSRIAKHPKNWLIAAAREEIAFRSVEKIESLAAHKRRTKPKKSCPKCGNWKTKRRDWCALWQCPQCGGFRK